ncbi:Histamine H2 receptor [Trichoplax sp. H2]|nr:Histamine H2 receptor [Trichoplax sp. H2]|eukprot:RDD36971.1 Histamine H2 receptor [Trichoplax sp. H2]
MDNESYKISKFNSSLSSEDIVRVIVGNSIATITVLFNLFNILIILSKKQMQNVTNVIMASMFLADIMFALAYLYPSVGNPTSGEENWLYCNLSSNIPIAIVISINLHLVAVSVDKLIALQAPIRYHVYSKPRYAIIIVAFIWIVSALIGFIPIMTFRPILRNECFAWNPQNPHEFHYSLVQIIIFFILPFFAISIIYYRIFCIAKSFIQNRPNFSLTSLHREQVMTSSPRVRKHLKAAKVLAIIVVTYFIMWTPFYIDSLVSILNPQLEDESPTTLAVRSILIYLTFTYPAVNAILYGYLVSDIRKTVCKLKITRNHKTLPSNKTIKSPIINVISIHEL